MRALATLLATLLVTATLATASGTQAGARDREWCSEDPTFTVLGATFRLTTLVASPASEVTGVEYVIVVPENAGTVGVDTPPGEALAAVTRVTVSKTGPAYTGGTFEVRVTLTVNGPDHTKVVAQLDGPSVKDHHFNGKTNKPLSFEINVTP